MVFVKDVGLNFYRHVTHRVRGVHVKNQLNSLLKSHFSRPLKNAKIGFSGTSPGFWLKTKLRRIHPPTHPKLLKPVRYDLKLPQNHIDEVSTDFWVETWVLQKIADFGPF